MGKIVISKNVTLDGVVQGEKPMRLLDNRTVDDGVAALTHQLHREEGE